MVPGKESLGQELASQLASAVTCEYPGVMVTDTVETYLKKHNRCGQRCHYNFIRSRIWGERMSKTSIS